jgi:hypothetical protein
LNSPGFTPKRDNFWDILTREDIVLTEEQQRAAESAGVRVREWLLGKKLHNLGGMVEGEAST